jgi:hypothetical protein
MSEQQITDSIVEYLRMVGNSDCYESSNPGRIRNRKVVAKAKRLGISDLIWVYHGIYIALEVKTETGKQSPGQKLFQHDIQTAGGLYYLVTSIHDVIKIIDELNASHWFSTYKNLRYYDSNNS